MKKLLAVLIVLAAVPAFAGTSSVTYTTGQSTAIQTKVIPALNAERCGNFGLSASCTSAQLVSAGCVVQLFKGVAVTGCTIYTENAAGEQALIQLLANQSLAAAFVKQNSLNEAAFKGACAAASGAAQDTVCTTVGLPSGCNPCQ